MDFSTRDQERENRAIMGIWGLLAVGVWVICLAGACALIAQNTAKLKGGAGDTTAEVLASKPSTSDKGKAGNSTDNSSPSIAPVLGRVR